MYLESNNLVDLLSQRARQTPTQVAYTFLSDGEDDARSLTYAELEQRAKAIAAYLQKNSLPGERILLCYPSGLEYIAAFFGCLYAGALAVPLYPPHARRVDERIEAIRRDAQPTIALTTTKIAAKMQQSAECAPDSDPKSAPEPAPTTAPESKKLRWIATEKLGLGSGDQGPGDQGLEDQRLTERELAEAWQAPELTESSLAYLQYTSGSTSDPKGVMVSHGNLLYNLRDSYASLEHRPDDVMVSWLPLFHDMGLIFGILYPLYIGIHGVFMAPSAFIESPIRWLKAISRYKGTHSGAPHFGYDYCLQKIAREERSQLDLHSWRFGITGAEPVRAATMKGFAEGFAEAGLMSHTLAVGYGLAEATLKVTTTLDGQEWSAYTFNQDALARNKVVAEEQNSTSRILVSCGTTGLETRIVIANPETLEQCAPDEVGEIWVGGPTVAQGYWENEEATKSTFGAYLQESSQGPFLRTGDLGFLYEGELFITGRLKDLIILRGRNHYPQDIESTAAKCHAAFHPDRAVAVALHKARAADPEQAAQAGTNHDLGPERLVVVLEVERQAIRSIKGEEAIWAIRSAIAEEHEIQPYAVVLTKPGQIPMTTSGKVRRRACGEMYLNNQLAILAEWQADDSTFDGLDLAAVSQPTVSPPTAELIQARLCQWLAQQLQVSVALIDPTKRLADYGLDSLMTFELRDALYHSANVEIPLADLFEELTIESLTEQIVTKLSAAQPINDGILNGEILNDGIQNSGILNDGILNSGFLRENGGASKSNGQGQKGTRVKVRI